MKYTRVKAVTCALTASVIIFGSAAHTNASSVSYDLPAAGVGLVLEEGSSLSEAQEAPREEASPSEPEAQETPEAPAVTSEDIEAGATGVGEAAIDTEVVEHVEERQVASAIDHGVGVASVLDTAAPQEAPAGEGSVPAVSEAAQVSNVASAPAESAGASEEPQAALTAGVEAAVDVLPSSSGTEGIVKPVDLAALPAAEADTSAGMQDAQHTTQQEAAPESSSEKETEDAKTGPSESGKEAAAEETGSSEREEEAPAEEESASVSEEKPSVDKESASVSEEESSTEAETPSKSEEASSESDGAEAPEAEPSESEEESSAEEDSSLVEEEESSAAEQPSETETESASEGGSQIEETRPAQTAPAQGQETAGTTAETVPAQSQETVGTMEETVPAQTAPAQTAPAQGQETAGTAAQAAPAESAAAQESASESASQAETAESVSTASPVAAHAPVSSAGSTVADFALQFVGNPYEYGGTSLTNGADCSGFVMSVYENFGVSLPHSSSADRNVGTEVAGGLSNAQAGDIVCYSGHVGIYIGNGQIVHASTEETGIKVSDADYRTPITVRRIFS